MSHHEAKNPRGKRPPFHYEPPLRGGSNPAARKIAGTAAGTTETGAVTPGAPAAAATRTGTTPGSFALPPRIGAPGAYSSPDTPGMPAPSDKTAWDFSPAPRGESAAVTQLEKARLGTITPEMRRVAEREPHLSPEQIRDEIAAGRMIIPANRVHLSFGLDPTAIGRAATTKINANLGASPVSSETEEEIEKMRWAVRWGADAVMDLSTGGDLDATREAIIRSSPVPVGTVPVYSMIVGRRIEDLSHADILREIEHQAKQGVDFITIHAGLLREHIPYVRGRVTGIVSRGGSLLAKWMIHHGRQNPFYDLFDEISDIVREYDVSFSLGDGLRPGSLADSTDEAQLRELDVLGELTERAWAKGVQVMIEGPGHIPFDQIEYNMKVERALCHGAPFYVLGPLVTDIFPGYDHITSAIGATAAAYHGASFLCYVTPKEHLGLPKKKDVKDGCIAYKIAAHAADIALGIPETRGRDDELSKARAALNWEKHIALSFDPDTARAFHDEDLHVDTDFCAMCGHDWCAVRISKEIEEFASGKEKEYAWDAATPSPGLTAEQREILEERGVLTIDEIRALAGKTRASVAPRGSKPVCHSDLVEDAAQAKELQEAKVRGGGPSS